MTEKKKTKKKIVSNIVLLIAIGVFLFSGYELFEIFSEYQKGDSEYEHIRENVIQEKESVSGEGSPRFVVDFATLKEINPEIAAWIRFDESSQISYPVAKGADNDKYLHTTFEGKKNASGTLFVDYENNSDFTDRNTFIYGHNMKNGSMFGKLRQYRAQEFCQANPYFYIYTPDGKEITYQVFAVSIVKATSEIYQIRYADDEEFLNYIESVKKLSLYSTNVEVEADSQIVSLSTCTNRTDDERILVQGVKIGER